MNVLRKILFPIVPIYYLVTWLRNKLYDWGIKKSRSYNFPVIAVGNLSVGGTGKSPMVEYLIRLLKDEVLLATLSRGYKRETKGFYLVKSSSTAKEVGDEPLQFKTKFNDVLVAVDADRRNGIANLRALDPKPEVVVLDDAYQHRKVKAGFYIMLTSYDNLYCSDIVLPTGNLREPRSGANRANSIVVTKCPKEISQKEMEEVAEKLKVSSQQSLFFATIEYGGEILNAVEKKPVNWLQDKTFALVTGIANPKPLLDHYSALGLRYRHINFPDHHNFTVKELKSLGDQEIIVTTEKDYMRLASHFSEQKLWYQPIVTKFIKDEEMFKGQLLDFVKIKNNKT